MNNKPFEIATEEPLQIPADYRFVVVRYYLDMQERKVLRVNFEKVSSGLKNGLLLLLAVFLLGAAFGVWVL